VLFSVEHTGFDAVFRSSKDKSGKFYSNCTDLILTLIQNRSFRKRSALALGVEDERVKIREVWMKAFAKEKPLPAQHGPTKPAT
jgi:hypothetical protein